MEPKFYIYQLCNYKGFLKTPKFSWYSRKEKNMNYGGKFNFPR